MNFKKSALWTSAALIGLALVVAAPASADQVFLDDIIVDGSACIGFDCVNGEPFGFDTIRIKENNLRIRAVDTSTSASFPSRDWQIVFNDSSNGGANKFSIDDLDGGRTPFTIEAGAPSHSLYVDDGGRIGFGTSTPVVDLHVKSGNTPTLRLEQDGSSGFTAQTWDVAGNETNFFIRDASNGSKLPLRIRPNAPSNSIFVDADGDVGLGTSAPGTLSDGSDASLHVRRTDGDATLFVEEASTTTAERTLFEVKNNGTVRIAMSNAAASWNFKVPGAGTLFQISKDASGLNQMSLDDAGNVTFQGVVSANNGGATLPDFVFEPDYTLMPLAELEEFVMANKHLPRIPSRDEVSAAGGVINMSDLQYKLLEKVEELTLYTIAQQETIDALSARVESLVVED